MCNKSASYGGDGAKLAKCAASTLSLLITCTDSGGPLEFAEPGATCLVAGPSPQSPPRWPSCWISSHGRFVP